MMFSKAPLLTLALAFAAATALASPLEFVKREDSQAMNIYPTDSNFNPDKTKCVGIVGGVPGNGVNVDIYDCNGSATQKWYWTGPNFGNQLALYNPSATTKYCLDAGNVNEIENGTKLKIWQCYDDLPQQRWNRTDVDDGYSGVIGLRVKQKCLDLTDGSKANRNVLQVWDCTTSWPHTNQLWTTRFV